MVAGAVGAGRYHASAQPRAAAAPGMQVGRGGRGEGGWGAAVAGNPSHGWGPQTALPVRLPACLPACLLESCAALPDLAWCGAACPASPLPVIIVPPHTCMQCAMTQRRAPKEAELQRGQEQMSVWGGSPPPSPAPAFSPPPSPCVRSTPPLALPDQERCWSGLLGSGSRTDGTAKAVQYRRHIWPRSRPLLLPLVSPPLPRRRCLPNADNLLRHGERCEGGR